MKKIIVCFTLAAVAALPVFAGEKCCKDKAACAGKDKAACADKAKTECKDQSACTKTPSSKKSLMSPKAADTSKKS